MFGHFFQQLGLHFFLTARQTLLLGRRRFVVRFVNGGRHRDLRKLIYYPVLSNRPPNAACCCVACSSGPSCGHPVCRCGDVGCEELDCCFASCSGWSFFDSARPSWFGCWIGFGLSCCYWIYFFLA